MRALFHPHLPFADHMHQIDAGQDHACAPEIFEAQHRLDDPFDGPMILLDDVVQVLILSDLDRCRDESGRTAAPDPLGNALPVAHRDRPPGLPTLTEYRAPRRARGTGSSRPRGTVLNGQLEGGAQPLLGALGDARVVQRSTQGSHAPVDRAGARGARCSR